MSRAHAPLSLSVRATTSCLRSFANAQRPWALLPGTGAVSRLDQARQASSFSWLSRPRSSTLPRASLQFPCSRLAHSQTISSKSEGTSSSSAQEPLDEQLSTQLGLPLFRARAKDLDLIESPAHFFQVLKDRIDSAQDRIFISSLYIGKEENELISHIHAALARAPNLRVTVLLDALRSTREGPTERSGASLVARLAGNFPDRVDVRLYHTPALRGLMKRILPRRFDEGWGLQHMKLYGFDDSVVISGANLSHDYFTNRRDRYLLIRSHPLLANYLHALLLLVSRFSFALEARPRAHSSQEIEQTGTSEAATAEKSPQIAKEWDWKLVWDGGNRLLLGEDGDGSISEAGTLGGSSSSSRPDESSPFPSRGWAARASEDVKAFTRRWKAHTDALYSASSLSSAEKKEGQGGREEWDTTLVPLLQMGPLGITQETEAVPRVFEYADNLVSEASSEEFHESGEGKCEGKREGAARTDGQARLDLTSGYFSLYAPYKKRVLNGKAQMRIIAAAPESNGFFNSRGVSRLIPPGYTRLEQLFFNELTKAGARDRVELREWKKEGWTYHAKGIWLSPPASASAFTSSTSANEPPRTQFPTHTILGSSNYGSRSASLDLECSLLISTHSSEFRERLSEEVEGLRKDARDVVDEALFERPERRTGWGLRIAAWALKGML